MMMMAILNAAVQVMKCRSEIIIIIIIFIALEQSGQVDLTFPSPGGGEVQAHGSKELSTL